MATIAGRECPDRKAFVVDALPPALGLGIEGGGIWQSSATKALEGPCAAADLGDSACIMRSIAQLLDLLPNAEQACAGSLFEIVVSTDHPDTSNYDAAFATFWMFGRRAVAYSISNVFGDCHRLCVEFDGCAKEAVELFDRLQGRLSSATMREELGD